ncbi:cytochrome c oxidase subunit 3 [Haladaptatus litoreus]|uniref:Cytochrome c oxidase subunit 3 n=1 Tax=Haladaptatus litoreus TaxID=553468 RepID=A0A1N6X570_9EURY|nr:cytochrome c oxidase subunit 3 [Haladaptatus litoreus]SIQ97410.1 cytochrome c oxidase subunit 3 [Haladaptatus litoreus]
MTDSATSGATADTDAHESHHERSQWPVVSAIGAGLLYAGVALFLLGRATDVIPAIVGAIAGVVGFGAFVAGLVGWLNQAYLAGYWRNQASARKRRAYRATMILFLVTDVATFAAGFTYYVFVRIGGWPQDLPDVLTSLVLVNTVLLVLSSFTLHFSHAALENDRRNRFLALLGVTILLGVAFVAGQVLEYYEFVVGEGFTLTSGIFGSAFYGLTGLHGLHVTLGVILLGIVFWRARRGQYDSDRDTSITTVSYYWHFVDVVWLILVLMLYVGAEITV